MVNLRQLVSSAVASLFVVLASCAAPPAPGYPERVDEICSASCARRSACNAQVEESSCEAECRATGSKARKYWRADYVDAASSCLRALPCTAARSSKERQMVCFANAIPTPSPAVVRLANLMVDQDRACHVFYNDPPTVAQRERSFAVYDDRIIEQMIACQQQGCEGRHGTRWACTMNVIGQEPVY